MFSSLGLEKEPGREHWGRPSNSLDALPRTSRGVGELCAASRQGQATRHGGSGVYHQDCRRSQAPHAQHLQRGSELISQGH